MLTVDHYELIRRKVLLEGLSQRQTAEELNHSRKTVAKALAERLPPGYRLSEPRPRPVLEPVKPILDACRTPRRGPSSIRRLRRCTSVCETNMVSPVITVTALSNRRMTKGRAILCAHG